MSEPGSGISNDGMPRIGLALGAGGASGLAHILMLEVFDELGIKPAVISGCSIGAVIGGLYASSNSASDIRKLVENLIARDTDTWEQKLLEKNIFKWVEFLEPEIGKGGLISGDAFISYLYTFIKVDDFEELHIPLKVVATDFWKREQVVFDSGPLVPAIEGSMALPGLFSPVQHNGSLLIDGGTMNPLPYDLLFDDCDVVVAIDVAGRRTSDRNLSLLDTVFQSFQIMQQAIVNEKSLRRQADIYIRPELMNVRALEFYKMDEIYRQAADARRELKDRLEELLSAARQKQQKIENE